MLETIPNSVSYTTQNDKVADTKNPARLRLWQLHSDDAGRYVKSGQFRKARQKLRLALREAMHFGETDERLARTLVNLIACEVELNDGELSSKAALQLAEDSTRVHKTCYGEHSEYTASCFLNVGVLLELNQHYHRANEALAEAITIVRAQEGQSERHTALLCNLLYNRASLLWSCDQFNPDPLEVFTLADEAYNKGQAVHGSQDRLVITIKQLRDDVADACNALEAAITVG